MKYKILIGKENIVIDEEEKNFFVSNQDKKFIALKSGELVNVAFVQGIVIDRDATREESTQLKMESNMKRIEAPTELNEEEARKMFGKYKPDFIK